MFYAGDYDAAAWVAAQLKQKWDDPARGSVPIGWALDPALSARFPPAWGMVLGSRSASDTVITGDSGAGYLNPTMLRGETRLKESGLPDGTAAWAELNGELNNQLGISFTGFVISGDAPKPGEADNELFFNFSSNGIVNQGWGDPTAALTRRGMPVVTQTDISANANDAAAFMATFCHQDQDAPTWMMFRSVLTTPSYLSSVRDAASAATGGAAVAVGPLELSYLMRPTLGGDNDHRVAYVSDTLPSQPGDAIPSAGDLVAFTVTVRNDGWNSLGRATHKVTVTVPGLQPVAQASPGHGAGGGGDARAGGGRAAWASAGLVALDGGAVGGRSARKSLARRGFVGDRPAPLARSATGTAAGASSGEAAYFSLPSDLPAGGSVTVSCTFQVPPLAAFTAASSPALRSLLAAASSSPPSPSSAAGLGAGVVGLVEVSYQLVEMVQNVAVGFDQRGILPWQASIPVANSTKAT